MYQEVWACKIQYLSSPAKTKLSFNVLPKIVSWTHKKKSLVFSSKGLFIYRLLRAQYTIMSCSYAYTFVRKRAILPCLSIHQSTCLWTVLVRARALYPLWDRGLPLSTNIALHVWTRINTGRPPPVIVVLIWSPQSCFITLIQDCNLNISIEHSSFGTHWPGPLVVVPFATYIGPLDVTLDLQCPQ